MRFLIRFSIDLVRWVDWLSRLLRWLRQILQWFSSNKTYCKPTSILYFWKWGCLSVWFVLGAFCVTCRCYCRLFWAVTCLFFFHRFTTDLHTHTNGVSDPVVTWTSGSSFVSYLSCLCAVNMFCESLLSIRECASLQPATVRHWTKPLRHWTAPGRFCLKAVITMKITQCDEHVLSVLLHLLWCLIIYDLQENENKKEIP